ncbi:hypothetical protein HYALB_00003512 [Hymenoscyphus albidus]|uniref:Kinesin-like protein n=1 Tax=Hymenoscyphus albidus TaxID=595503 RepID=A0A9N9LQP1_9HELO|nr:hypothetical protein HYALB_00003512 [Hymenoscyphus albidus]
MDVQLYIYDLSNGLARQFSAVMLGTYIDMVYHTGIVMEGVEYTYDGGIKALKPGKSHLGEPLRIVELGTTELPMEVIQEYLESLKEIYTQDAYNIWTHNCNNFANDFATFLLGKGIPEYITNLPETFLNSDFGRAMVPKINRMVEKRQNKNGGLLGLAEPNNALMTHEQISSSVRAVTTPVALETTLMEAKRASAVIFFTSATCAPCKKLYPLYDQLAAETAHKVILIQVDISRSYDIGMKYSIKSTPTFISFLHGEQQEIWSGADAAKLEGNVRMLARMAFPPHKHESLALPALRGAITTPVLYSKIPPLGKLKAKMGAAADDSSITEVMGFVAARAEGKSAETHLPDLDAFSRFLRSAPAKLPTEIMFTVVDLLRVALVDPRLSGYYAEEKAHLTIAPILSYVNHLKDCPYSLRLVTLQMACNLFSSPLYPNHILSCPTMTKPIMDLVTTSLLDDKHQTVRIAAASLSFNITTANGKLRLQEHRDGLSEDDQVELAASLLEAIIVEEQSPEALKGFLLALGYLTYLTPGDGELVELLEITDAQGAVRSKKTLFSDEKLVQDETLLDTSLAPELMPKSITMNSPRTGASTPSLRARAGSEISNKMETPAGNVRVVVRVRGFLPRETERGAQCLIEMDPATQATTLLPPNDTDTANSRSKMRKVIEEKSFTFDNSFWSHNKKDEHYAHQEDVYNCLGEEFLDHNFEGYHTCIFAYGQTGSGKSYTMMGTPDQPGLIPRTCEDLFERIEAAAIETPSISYNVRVSYFEVYNEHVRDLLTPVKPNQPPYYLKIRESPTEGPYVKDLTDAPVRNLTEILRYMQMGDTSRTTASTKMNDTSSRSHSVFTIMLKQIHHDMDTDETTERVARIRLVDLAGSERAKATEATGTRLREGSNINKSLTTLGRVIAALADPKQNRPGKRSNKDVVPYRDSILTWLLKDSLGGNSKTAMIACIAPSDYDETLSTLRYADQAKRIRTRAVVNQDLVSAAERDAQIAQMAEEIRILTLSVSEGRRREKEDKEQEEKIEEYQNRVIAMQRLMEERSQVAEGKIRALNVENEALRLHLKLAIDSIKNPINVRSSVPPEETIEILEGSVDRDPEAAQEADFEDDKTEVPDYDSDCTSDEAVDLLTESEKRAEQVQEFQQDLLSDLARFMSKVMDDKSRFMTPMTPDRGFYVQKSDGSWT